MQDDKILIRKFKQGSSDALRSIYEKYRTTLLTVATALCNNIHTAEDAVQDCFISFARSAQRIKSKGSLKGYLTASVVNRVRDTYRAAKHNAQSLDQADTLSSREQTPAATAICNEQMQTVRGALEKIPTEQREVVVLHTRGRLTFKEIAKIQDVAIPTVQARYRYGLDKLRILLNGEVTK